MEQGSLPPPPGLADLTRDMRKLCNFHFAGGCTRGSICKFRHDLQPGEQPPLCKYFGTPQGCRFGDSCRMAHGNADLAGDAMRDAWLRAGSENSCIWPDLGTPPCRIDARFCNRADPGRAKYIAQVIVHAHNLSTFICEQTFGYMCSVLPLSE